MYNNQDSALHMWANTEKEGQMGYRSPSQVWPEYLLSSVPGVEAPPNAGLIRTSDGNEAHDFAMYILEVGKDLFEKK